MSYHNSAKAEGVKHCIVALANFQNSVSTLAPASIDKSACSPAGIMSPGLGPAELLRNCLLDWAPSGANKKWPPGLGPGSFLKKLQWGPVFLCQIEYGTLGPARPPTALHFIPCWVHPRISISCFRKLVSTQPTCILVLKVIFRRCKFKPTEDFL